MQTFLCSGESSRATRQSIVPGNLGYEIRQQQRVNLEGRNLEVVVEQISGLATVRACGSWQQQHQQQAERQLQQLQQQPFRNDSGKTPNYLFRKKTCKHLFDQVCSYKNLLLAFDKAKKGKLSKDYVMEFNQNLSAELCKLQWELLTGIYKPRPLKTFIVRDPKTRKISASNFRDRVVHHAICNLVEPIFEPRFIYDNFANRRRKGTSAALKRFDVFIKKVSSRDGDGFALKADIKHYFDNVNHEILLLILRKRIHDERLINLISIILDNHSSESKGKGMPLGNLTSQFFANVYLNELDQYIKHSLGVRFYLRYVDDFVILSNDKQRLESLRSNIDCFLKDHLKLTLHPDKTKIIRLCSGVQLLGFRVFYYYKILKKSNLRRIMMKVRKYKEGLADGSLTHEHVHLSLAGWRGYAMMGNTYNLRREINGLMEAMV